MIYKKLDITCGGIYNDVRRETRRKWRAMDGKIKNRDQNRGQTGSRNAGDADNHTCAALAGGALAGGGSEGWGEY